LLFPPPEVLRATAGVVATLTVTIGPLAVAVDVVPFAGIPRFDVAPSARVQILDARVLYDIRVNVDRMIQELAAWYAREAQAASELPWDVLGLPGPVDEAAALQAYRQRAKELHPDTGAEDGDGFKRLAAAWDRIKQARGWR
jgi:hypothetical protein